MSELRWHPLLQEWVITSTERQDRTFLPPKDYCPLDPAAARRLSDGDPAPTTSVVSFQNKFPSLRPEPPRPRRPQGPSCTRSRRRRASAR